MSGHIPAAGPKPDEMLTFKRDTTLSEYGQAMKAYRLLIIALEGREPLYPEFTQFLVDRGYVE